MKFNNSSEEMSNSGDSSKRCRTRFNSWQIERFERVFIKTHYPDTQQMERLSIETKIPIQKMQIWFQNRRAKWRKNSRLKNFGGLASFTETEYVPAPRYRDTVLSLTNDITGEINEFQSFANKLASVETCAIDLRTRSLKGETRSLMASASDSAPVSSYLMPTISDKSNVYKKTGGITDITGTTNCTTNCNTNHTTNHNVGDHYYPANPSHTQLSNSLSNHMNAFEYPTAYYHRRNTDNSDMPFAFASNQTTMTSLLFAPHMYSLRIPSSHRHHSAHHV